MHTSSIGANRTINGSPAEARPLKRAPPAPRRRTARVQKSMARVEPEAFADRETASFDFVASSTTARARRQAASPARQRLTVTFLGYGHTVDPSSFPGASVPVPRQSPHQSVDPLDDWRQYVRLSLNGRGTTFPPCAPCVFDGPENSPYTGEPVHQPTTACTEWNNTHTRRRASARHEPFLI